MEERHEERKLTTADMATAGADRQHGTPDAARRAEPPKPAANATREGRQQDTMVAERPAAQPGRPATQTDKAVAMFPGSEGTRFRDRWDAIQAGFVDEPRRAVEQADALIAEVMQRLAQVFADERARLEGQWSRGNDISTEDLRQALRRYRGFFDRLLSV